ncbi:cupin domain-containing protein [Azovibrio restrictus]|uniref:cupin domain-containing protein n=1 Tax=Azovibrio restrictus TaxID=146938 RepID=UPI00040067FC|nr:cupin domain-containing protein [Azovibrio restrictus]
MRKLPGTLLLLGALGMPALGWAQAQAYPTQELLSTSTTVLGETIRYPDSGPARVTASIVTIAPGAETVFHRHPAPMFAYILEGEVSVDYGDQGIRVFRQGEALMEAMQARHRGTNQGSVPVRILSVHMGAAGTENVVLEK